MATVTQCAQWASDLADLIAARKRILAGGALSRVRHADKETAWHPANLGDLTREIRRLQALVDGCNGVSRPGFPYFIPTDC